MFKIRKKIKFDMGILLDTPYRKNRELYSVNSYELEVILKSDSLNDNGIVFDFKKFEEIVQSVIDKNFKNKCLVRSDKKLEAEFYEVLKKINIYFINYTPTLEKLARRIFRILYYDTELEKYLCTIILKKNGVEEAEYSNKIEYFD